MPSYLAQVLGGTRLDLQGERLPREVLDDFCAYAEGRRLPVHQQHDMSRPIVGYMENLRVEADPVNIGEWSLIGDIHLQQGSFDETWKGFSISAVVPIREVEDPHALLYIPYPAYNDQDLIAALSKDQHLKLGRWIKKNADGGMWAVFGAAIAFLLKPAWDDVYKRVITPIVDRFLSQHGERLAAKGLSLEHVQIVIFADHEVEVRFKPSPGKERYCFSETLLRKGLHVVARTLSSDTRAISPGVQRCVLVYDDGVREYALVRTEYKDGTVETTV